jgi:DNA adenine methylase
MKTTPIPFTGLTATKPAFPHPGGKTRLLAHILPLVPAHKVYVEPFCGACAVLLAKPPAPAEVINDADGDLVNFYRYVVHHPDALTAELKLWIGSARRNFDTLRRNPGVTDLQRAARWYLLRVASYGALSETFGRIRNAYHGYEAARHDVLIARLRERLARVTIESGDWEAVTKFFDTPETFFFFDPPYVDCAKTSYAPFTTTDMARVRARLADLKGRWLLTCDDSPACRKIFAGLPAQNMSIKYSLGSRSGVPKTSGELLIMHPALAPLGTNIIPFTPSPRATRQAA